MQRKIAITGHTKGIGKCLYKRLTDKGYEVRGYSTSTGYNILRPNRIINDVVGWADVFVNNAYAPGAQTRLLYSIYEEWYKKSKLIVNLGATSSDSVDNFSILGYSKDWTPYVSDKARLDFACTQLSKKYKKGRCRVTNIRPGFVNTDSTSTFKMFVKRFMMKPDKVAEMIEWVIEQDPKYQIRELSFDMGNI